MFTDVFVISLVHWDYIFYRMVDPVTVRLLNYCSTVFGFYSNIQSLVLTVGKL